MTTINEFGKEVFIYGTSIFAIVSFAAKNGLELTKQIIKNTYQKEDADYYIKVCSISKL